jgi:hypothetical protein
MTWFADRSPCSYFGDEYTAGLVAIGWLEGDHDFKRGDVPAQLIARLDELFENLWVPLAFCGYHSCSLCTSAKPRGGTPVRPTAGFSGGSPRLPCDGIGCVPGPRPRECAGGPDHEAARSLT